MSRTRTGPVEPVRRFPGAVADRILVSSMAEAGRIGSAGGYRLVFAFLALILLAALVVYRRAPERRLPTTAPAPPGTVQSTMDPGSARP